MIAVEVGTKTNEIPLFTTLLDRVDIADAVITAGALHAQHGRTGRRTLKVTSVKAGLAFPHAAQAIRIVRRRKVEGNWSAETCYAVTSLTVTQASCAELAAIIRGHWGILKTGSIGSATLTSTRTARRCAPPAARASWPACATLSSPSCGSPGPPVSPPPCATMPASPAALSRRS